jgi:NADPH-dependent glutamate synthase beta subunit-like oxidoreductase/Pyruvate/2-oxoacid:ferredoxin oxidoreductase delta subunit
MSLLRKSEGIKPLRPRTSVPAASAVSPFRPAQIAKAGPCATGCLAGSDIRGVLALLAQREKLGLSEEQAFDQAWRRLVETNPFPATTGRICPHQCEQGCNRHQKDGGVAVGAIERFIGDWGLERGLALPDCPAQPVHPERVAIIGAGPAGLCCAYQLVRCGYASTIFEGMPEPGGMLRYGIPPYRLPHRVLAGEIQRIVELSGVELRTNTRIGRDVSLDELRRDFGAVFIAPGAGASRQSISGVEGQGVCMALDYLRDVAQGRPPDVGQNVVIVGGGNTAIDVARVCARLLGKRASITLLRRRNPDVGAELAEAIEEGIRVELLTTISSVVRDATGKLTRVVAQRVELGPKDSRGSRELLLVPDSCFEIEADSIIVALGQKPNVGILSPGDPNSLEADAAGKTQLSRVWRGGDAVTPSFAAVVISQGRRVALSIDAELRGMAPTEPPKLPELQPARLKLGWYEPQTRLARLLAPVAERLADLQTEVELGHCAADVLGEASRCLSCGSCFGCERCWMFCTPGCLTRLPQVVPGRYFNIKLENCDGCRKCAEECPCGFLEMS